MFESAVRCQEKVEKYKELCDKQEKTIQYMSEISFDITECDIELFKEMLSGGEPVQWLANGVTVNFVKEDE